ncbi:RNA ligase family protein [Anaerovibrio slackiae]|nr:RNA ligase family protein [Anaerovibrio slackiae]
METTFYQHVERLGNDEVQGILDGMVYLFTKLDGTNIGIHSENGEVKVNSRKRAIAIGCDNAGSCKYVMDNPKFASYLKAHPQHYLYGEFLVPHTIRSYSDDAWRKVYIFDVVDYSDGYPRYLTYEEYQPLLEEYGIEYIPLIAKLENPTEAQLSEYLQRSNFLQSDASMPGEGIVLKNYGFRNEYGRTTWAKLVRTEFKMQKKCKVSAVDVEHGIVDQYLTTAFIEKELAKVLNDIGTWNNKYIGRCLGTVWHELIVENTWDIVKKFKNPKIDFGVLNVLANEKIKQVMSKFFKEQGITLPF